MILAWDSLLFVYSLWFVVKRREKPVAKAARPFPVCKNSLTRINTG